MKPGKRLTKYERKENREKKLKMDMAGTGLYIYENNTDGDLTLPKATASGQRKVGPRKRFQGDSYFMTWVKPPLNLLKFIETVTEKKEETLSEKKLILDQPDIITNKGKIEHVVDDTPQKLHETNPNKKQEVLLTEDPLDGVEIILG